MDERTVRRLEAFSDIVIGFSLAQLGAALSLDVKTMTLDVTGVIVFFSSFAIICSLWYFHHRLFEYFFVPKSLPIALNFVWLSVVVLLVFVAMKSSGSGFNYRNLNLLYFGLYGLAYAILAAQTAIGIREREHADEELRTKARRNLFFMSYWTLVFWVCLLLVWVMPNTPALGNAISFTFAAGGTGSFLAGRYMRRRQRAAVSDA